MAWGFFKKLVDRGPTGAVRERRIRLAAELQWAAVDDCDDLFRLSDLLRLLRLLGHRHRLGARARIQADGELRTPYHAADDRLSSGAAGTFRCRPGSATTVYIPHGRQPRRPRRYFASAVDICNQRPLARRELDVRGLGHYSTRFIWS